MGCFDALDTVREVADRLGLFTQRFPFAISGEYLVIRRGPLGSGPNPSTTIVVYSRGSVADFLSIGKVDLSHPESLGEVRSLLLEAFGENS